MQRLAILLLLALMISCVGSDAWAQKKALPPGPPIPDEPVLPVVLKKSFTNLRVRRPIVATHAGDGTDRLFLAEQQGVILVIPNDPEVEETQTFLDIEDQVRFNPKQNEEGLLGLAFHPKYKENGYFFVYYTDKAGLLSRISRFQVSAEDPNKADPKSELVLMEIEQPFWNHNGGGIQFGPDGYLYIALGDGGNANDPHSNGQNLSTLLGSILRIDIDNQQDGKNYAIPADNPFVNQAGARPEIYAYGLRNVWGMAFDSKTGKLWIGDVGQNLWEEVNIIENGGNYGWNVREAKHPFGPEGKPASDQYIEPVYEYYHNHGKSITGGLVYRGKQVPQLAGKYLFADYVTGKVWALDYDNKSKQAGEVYRIEAPENPPVVGYGVDQHGEPIMIAIYGKFGTFYRFESAN